MFVLPQRHNIVVRLLARSRAAVGKARMAQGHGSDRAIDISQLRNPYHSSQEAFTEDKLASKDPIKQFEHWFKDAAKDNINDVNAMTLATVGSNGRPSARIVLLKGFGQDGFKFFTNHRSKKGQDLAVNPYVALVFYWGSLHRSIRVEGKAEKLTEEESVAYFRTRPRLSQIAAHVSANQSSPIQSRNQITQVDKELQKKFEGCEVAKPSYWGGYIVRPDSIEFWHGHTTRMHDRIRFRKIEPDDNEIKDSYLKQGENGWWYERLMP